MGKNEVFSRFSPGRDFSSGARVGGGSPPSKQVWEKASVKIEQTQNVFPPGGRQAGRVFSFCSSERPPESVKQWYIVMSRGIEYHLQRHLLKVDLVLAAMSDIPQLVLLLLREPTRLQKVLLPGLVSITIFTTGRQSAKQPGTRPSPWRRLSAGRSRRGQDLQRVCRP